MSRRFTIVTVALAAVVSLLIGVIIAGGFGRSRMAAGDRGEAADTAERAARGPGSLVNFADVVERINPAVVNIDATSRPAGAARRRGRSDIPGRPDLFGPDSPQDAPRRGAGSGFIIDTDGSILTNHHVIDRADRIIVKLSDGRTLRARVIGTDPETDVALIKVDGQPRLPVAPLGDSSSLRMGEWVCAIGNPLGYEHSVTVGVVSFLGRKLFDSGFDDYIQTDAAIHFGNSGGPLINSRGEVIGINAAISSRASNIGFAVPINGARAILPQLKAHGRVSRGYIGVYLREVDQELQQALQLPVAHGAFVQEVTESSPASRAGLKPYDVILSFDNRDIDSDDELIKAISGATPGTSARLRVLRDGREQTLAIKLAERPGAASPATPARIENAAAAPPADRVRGLLGLTVRDLDASAFNQFSLPGSTRGVLITRVEPMSASFDAELRRNTVILEINRRPLTSVADYQRVAEGARPGDVLAFYVYLPDVRQRKLITVRAEAR
jgi:serine protease Do